MGDELDDVDVDALADDLFADEGAAGAAAAAVPGPVLAEIEAAVVELIERG